MMRQCSCYSVVLAASVICAILFCDAQVKAETPAELNTLIKKIDMELCTQSEADIRALLDKLIETYWKPGQTLKANYDTGGPTALGAMWFRGYEMLDEKPYLEAGLDLVDAILQTQRGDGMFAERATLQRKGNSAGHGNPTLQDEYNFAQFALVCYAYKLTGDRKYRAAALKHAEALRPCQDPARDATWQGPWPHTWHNLTKPRKGGPGYEPGYMLNDYATWDGMRTMIMAYKLSGDKKFIKRLNLLPAYILNANVGLGNVRGWRGQTDAWNETTWQRRFEGPLIDPRNFNRFACPMLAYFSAVMHRDVGLNMLRESYAWLRSVERKDGWSYKYTYDGRPAHTGAYRNIVLEHGVTGQDVFARTKVVLDAPEKILEVTNNGTDVEALRKWYGRSPTAYSEAQYLAARLAAARRVTHEALTVRLWSLTEDELTMGGFLERVRQRPLQSPRIAPPTWGWWRPVRRPVPFRGWAAWQYVWDVRVARGEIDADTAAWGGRGLESAGAPTWFFPRWDCVGDWSTKCIEAESWIDIPLKSQFTHVKGVRLEPAEMPLKLLEAGEIKPIFTPADATCQTGTWKVAGDFGACYLRPQMLKGIDPTVKRPSYPLGGKIMVHAGLPHTFPARAVITFTSTDGRHSAICAVTVRE